MNTRIPPFTSLAMAVLLATSGAAQAAHDDGDGFTTQAKVLSSTPIYDRINEPRRECWTETQDYETRSYRDGNTGGTIIGAIAGGLIGSTVGKGNGKVAAAAVGAATGAVVGNRWNKGERRYETHPQQVERCEVHDNFRQVISGYDVRYRFQGRVYSTRLPYDPGNTLTLNVSFSVAGQQDGSWKNSRNDWDD